MRLGGFLGIYSAICLLMSQQITTKTCQTKVVSFEQFKASGNAVLTGGNAGMSSHLGSYPPQNCMDGNEDTFCHTEEEENPYFMIDYTVPIKVTDVKVTARKNCCYNRVKQLVVIVTDTKPTKGKSALESGTQLGSTFIGPATSAGQEITFSSRGGVMGRYVVIQQLYQGVMNLAEVQVNERELYRKMMKTDYKKCLENTACEDCFTVIETYLPELVQANMINAGEIPVFGVNNGKKKWKTDPYASTLSLIEGDDIITRKTNNELITFNGTVPGYIGKRDYSKTLRRTTGLYVGAGDIVTITFPEEVVGKIRVFIGHTGNKFKSRLEVKHSIMKVASPFGGLLLIWMNARKGAKPKVKGDFTIKVDNAIKAPTFIYNENTNEQWNKEIKHYSPKWAVLRIPGQLVIFVQTLRIKGITDMEASMRLIKKMMDNLEELVGLPPGSRPGEDCLKFNIGLDVAGVRSGKCKAGESAVGDNLYTEIKPSNDTSYDDFFIHYGVDGLVGHEMGHGWCLEDFPDMGNQWTAETVSGYLVLKSDSPRKSQRVRMTSQDLDFDLLHRMVAFNLYSKGKRCGKARFNRKQLREGAYAKCWKWLNWFPEKAHGWDVLKDVFTLDQRSNKSYRAGTDRMVDLYCQATKHNMLPFFNLYNIQPKDETITNYCQKLPESQLITKWLNIVECVKQSMTSGKDIRICAKMPHFPENRGLCVISGVCSHDQTNDGQSTIMERKFDLYGSRKGLSKKDKETKTPSDTKEACFKRASDYFKDCKNNMLQPITATFYGKEQGNAYSNVLNNIFPSPGWRQKNEADCWGECGSKSGSCPTVCGVGGFCCRKHYGGCPAGAEEYSPTHHTCVIRTVE